MLLPTNHRRIFSSTASQEVCIHPLEFQGSSAPREDGFVEAPSKTQPRPFYYQIDVFYGFSCLNSFDQLFVFIIAFLTWPMPGWSTFNPSRETNKIFSCFIPTSKFVSRPLFSLCPWHSLSGLRNGQTKKRGLKLRAINKQGAQPPGKYNICGASSPRHASPFVKKSDRIGFIFANVTQVSQWFICLLATFRQSHNFLFIRQ